jgi:hypothetical protein
MSAGTADTQHLVLEYLEGETPATRIARGALRLAEAMRSTGLMVRAWSTAIS